MKTLVWTTMVLQPSNSAALQGGSPTSAADTAGMNSSAEGTNQSSANSVENGSSNPKIDAKAEGGEEEYYMNDFDEYPEDDPFEGDDNYDPDADIAGFDEDDEEEDEDGE